MKKNVLLMIIHAIIILVSGEFIYGQGTDINAENVFAGGFRSSGGEGVDYHISLKGFLQYEPMLVQVHEPDIKLMYYDGSPQGDYSWLRLSVTTDRKLYPLGFPVLLTITLENDVNNPLEFVSVDYNRTSSLFEFNQIELTDSNGDDVPLTLAGQRMKKRGELLKSGVIKDISSAEARNVHYAINGKFVAKAVTVVKLHPGEKCNILEGMRWWKQPAEEEDVNPFFLDTYNLCTYYDLTLPGTYHLKIYRSSVVEGQEFEEPLCSNTITFEIMDRIPIGYGYQIHGELPRMK